MYFVALLALAQAPAKIEVPSDYVLKAEDVVAITVVGMPQFSGEFLIPSSGVVDLPILGSQRVENLTIRQLTDKLTVGMRKRLKNPEVIVTLRIPRIDRVYIVGDLRSPGIIPYHPGWHLGEALAAAGGLVQGLFAADYNVNVMRDGLKRVFSFSDVLAGRADSNPELQPGDLVTVTTGPILPVNVIGEVKTPGLFRIRSEGGGVLEAIADAGGPLDTARTSHITIRHMDGTEEIANLTPAFIDGKSVALPKLRAGDLIIVPQIQNKYLVLGSVLDPGVFPYPEGKTLNLSDVLAIAKSSDSAAKSRYPRIGILRKVNGKDQRLVYNFGKFLMKGDTSQNPAILPFDVVYVPESPRVDLGTIFQGLQAGLFGATVFRN